MVLYPAPYQPSGWHPDHLFLEYKGRAALEYIGLGREESEKKMTVLIKLLLKNGRTEDLERASEDFQFREKLFRKYYIQN